MSTGGTAPRGTPQGHLPRLDPSFYGGTAVVFWTHTSAGGWPFTGCVVPGYPDMHPLAEGFWPLFWRIHNTAVERQRLGKIDE